MSAWQHSIAAIATAIGDAAIGIVRISGPDALIVTDKMSAGMASKAPERKALLCNITDHRGELIDQVLLTVFRAPHSYTGENVCELAGHGGNLVMRRLLERSLQCGAVAAGPGEFTQRAFLQGKLDLTQAEAVMDLISAQTDYAMRAAHEQREGQLGRRTEELRNDLLESVAHLEAYIDFPEEDISPEVGWGLQQRMLQILSAIDDLLATADRGRIIREGVRTVIHGAPNTGKSSLLNRLLGYDRAIVSPIAGTTRDTIEENARFGGILLRLIDTAGIREGSTDVIEQEGMRRADLQVERADLVLALFDATQAAPKKLPESSSAQRFVLPILNKSDCPVHSSWSDRDILRLSCMTGDGLDKLETAIASVVMREAFDQGQNMIAINARHQHCLRRAADSLQLALSLLRQNDDLTLASIELREALDALGEISGKIDSDDILGVIFSRFCIGK